MAYWLRFHIFTGLVGPYLALLHTAWRFNGLAGAVLLLTIIIVVSGFFGRYIYTAIPRTAEGVEVQARELEDQIQTIQAQIANLAAAHPAAAGAINQPAAFAAPVQAAGPLTVLGRAFSGLAGRLEWWQIQRKLSRTQRAQTGQLARLVRQQRALQNQMRSLAAARRMLAAWHAVHIPIGMALFTAAAIHIGAAIYFATLIH